jgi:hypothetical protein
MRMTELGYHLIAWPREKARGRYPSTEVKILPLSPTRIMVLIRQIGSHLATGRKAPKSSGSLPNRLDIGAIIRVVNAQADAPVCERDVGFRLCGATQP